MYTTSARFVEWVELSQFTESDKMKSLKNKIETMPSERSITRVSSQYETLETFQNQLDLLQSSQLFRLMPIKPTATVYVSLNDSVNERTLIKKVIITQIQINMNNATTGHKLQGMSVDKLLVVL